MDTSILESTLTTMTAGVADMAAVLGPKIGVVALAGVAVGALGFGINVLWRRFKGLAK